MRNSRIWRVIARVKGGLLPFQEMRHAARMIALAFIPAVAVLFVFECLPASAISRLSSIDPHAVNNHDLAPLFNYYISWVAHVLISIGVSFGAARSAFRDTSQPKKRVLREFRVLVCAVTLLIVLIADAMHVNLAMLSHERLFSVLALEPSLVTLFQRARMFAGCTVWGPTLFSLFPIGAIVAAFWATVTIIMCASKFLVELKRTKHNAAPKDRIKAFCDALEELRSHFLALSLVLVTSTLATIAYLRTPLGLLDESHRAAFKAIADAVGLAWGVTFSLTLLSLCIYPFIMLRRRLRALDRDADLLKDSHLDQWLRENRAVLQVPANLQLVLSVLLPATIAVLANLVST